VTVQAYDTVAEFDAAIDNCTTNCMYLKRFRGAMQLPDWVSGMREIRDVNDPAVDQHLDLGTRAWTLADRTLRVGHVSHLVGAAADILPVLHFDTLEAFDAEAFTGWVNTFDGINNFRSFVNLRLPSLGSLTAEVTVFPRGLGPNKVGAVQVVVRDAVGIAVADADVQLSATEFPGALAETTLVERALGSVAALGAYFRLTRHNLLAGVFAGAAAVWLMKLHL